MIDVRYHKDFDKKYKKLKTSEKKKFKKRLELFFIDETNPVLNNHSLKGKYLGCKSINITGDLRAVYKKSGNIATFITIDNHSNLYG